MITELITTGDTYDDGRVAINNAFSAETSFNILSASTIISGSTDLYDIFCTDCTSSSSSSYWTGGTSSTSITTINNKLIGGNAIGDYTFAAGNGTTASGDSSYAEGVTTIAVGSGSHAEGYLTTAFGNISHAEGNQTIASGWSSHAEGRETTTIGRYSHAEGRETTTIGHHSHAGGWQSTAEGLGSFIHSRNSIVVGDRSVVLGGQNLTGSSNDTVYVPKLNINTIGTATPIASLSLGSNGDIVTGSSSTSTSFTELLYTGATGTTWDATELNKILTITANTSLSIINSSDGDFGTLKVIQDSIGSHSIILPASSYVVNGGSGSITLTSNPNAIDILSYVKIGTDYHWNVGYNYS